MREVKKRSNNYFLLSILIVFILIIFSDGIFAYEEAYHTFDQIDFSDPIQDSLVINGNLSTANLCLYGSDISSCKQSWSGLSETGACPDGMSLAVSYFAEGEDTKVFYDSWRRFQPWIFGAGRTDTCNGDTKHPYLASSTGVSFCLNHADTRVCEDVIRGSLYWVLWRNYASYTISCKRRAKIECIEKINGEFPTNIVYDG